jgi:hypothetical protein
MMESSVPALNGLGTGSVSLYLRWWAFIWHTCCKSWRVPWLLRVTHANSTCRRSSWRCSSPQRDRLAGHRDWCTGFRSWWLRLGDGNAVGVPEQLEAIFLWNPLQGDSWAPLPSNSVIDMLCSCGAPGVLIYDTYGCVLIGRVHGLSGVDEETCSSVAFSPYAFNSYNDSS